MNAMQRLVSAAALMCVSAGCGETVDTSGLPDISDYQSWRRYDVTGDIPGHGDTYRIIYINDVARTYAHAGKYPLGTVLVKEIRDGSADGDLNYIAVMRRLADGDVSVELDDGWLFTYLDNGIDGDEIHVTSCWQNCHAQAPYRGAWFDYGAD